VINWSLKVLSHRRQAMASRIQAENIIFTDNTGPTGHTLVHYEAPNGQRITTCSCSESDEIDEFDDGNDQGAQRT